MDDSLTFFSDTLDFAFCVNDGYVPYICVTIKSILSHRKKNRIRIHILTDFISTQNIERLDRLFCNLQDAFYHIIPVDKRLFAGLITRSWSIVAWFRIFLPHYLPLDIKRVLYLDADTLVMDDLSELCLLQMEDAAIAGVLDPLTFKPETYIRCGYSPGQQYVCSGVLLMNLDYWRQHDITSLVLEYTKEHANSLRFPDQDAINAVCHDCKIILPLRFGVQASFFTSDYFYNKVYLHEILLCLEHPAIIHFAGNAPWIKERATHYYQKEWEHINRMLTPQAKQFYLTRGWPFVKMLFWNMVHPGARHKRVVTYEEIMNRISAAQKNDS